MTLTPEQRELIASSLQQTNSDYWLCGIDAVEEFTSRLLAALPVSEDAKDAARYRWFKENYLKYGNGDPDIRRPIILFDGRWYGGHFNNIDDLDKAIDATMGEQP